MTQGEAKCRIKCNFQLVQRTHIPACMFFPPDRKRTHPPSLFTFFFLTFFIALQSRDRFRYTLRSTKSYKNLYLVGSNLTVAFQRTHTFSFASSACRLTYSHKVEQLSVINVIFSPFFIFPFLHNFRLSKYT